MAENEIDRIGMLVDKVGELRDHLNRRFRVIVGAAVLGGAALLVVIVGTGIVLKVANDGRRVAKTAYLQSLINNRENLLYRRDFAQTRDCPVEYFKELLDVSRDKGDLFAVQPPCTPEDIGALDQKIAEVNQKIARARG